jgi:hypothetical protein
VTADSSEPPAWMLQWPRLLAAQCFLRVGGKLLPTTTRTVRTISNCGSTRKVKLLARFHRFCTASFGVVSRRMLFLGEFPLALAFFAGVNQIVYNGAVIVAFRHKGLEEIHRTGKTRRIGASFSCWKWRRRRGT